MLIRKVLVIFFDKIGIKFSCVKFDAFSRQNDFFIIPSKMFNSKSDIVMQFFPTFIISFKIQSCKIKENVNIQKIVKFLML